jgi:hypothetical protein
MTVNIITCKLPHKQVDSLIFLALHSKRTDILRQYDSCVLWRRREVIAHGLKARVLRNEIWDPYLRHWILFLYLGRDVSAVTLPTGVMFLLYWNCRINLFGFLVEHSTGYSTLIIIRDWYMRPVMVLVIVDSVPLNPSKISFSHENNLPSNYSRNNPIWTYWQHINQITAINS